MLKQKRKKCIIAAALVLFAIMLVGCVVWTGVIEIFSFNRASLTDTKLGASFSLEKLKNYETSDDAAFGMSLYQSADGFARIKVSKYPDTLLGASRVTGLYLYEGDTAHHILGIRIGDRANVAHELLGNNGFQVTHSGAGIIRAERGNIVIRMSINEKNRVSFLAAELTATNWFRLQYK